MKIDLNKKYFRASIRVIKSLVNPDDSNNWFGQLRVHEEKYIEAESKEEVKKILAEKFPQFFQNGKVYERETKDKAQFFYAIIEPIHFTVWDIERLESGEWSCSGCGRVHENKFVHTPKKYERVFGNAEFCNDSPDDYCAKLYDKKNEVTSEGYDDLKYVKDDSPIYIYKITEKSTNKCYIGKTKNVVFFRWYNHYQHSYQTFGQRLKSTSIKDWTFEVIDELPSTSTDAEVFRKESDYILKYDSINNGYNRLISNKNAYQSSGDLFEGVEEFNDI